MLREKQGTRAILKINLFSYNGIIKNFIYSNSVSYKNWPPVLKPFSSGQLYFTVDFKKFPFKNILHTTAYTAFGVLVFYFFIYFLNYHYHILASPFSLEYREGANILPTEFLLQGKNPFDFSNNPQCTNLYGIFYNLLIFPFAKIWGATLLLHRLVAGFFLFANCLTIVIVLKKNKIPFLISCTAGVMLYPLLLFPKTTTPLAGPHTLGMFLFLMTFYVPYFYNYSKTSLSISILSGLLAFYTKPYFLLGVPLTAFYIFLFKSKKNGALYGFIFFYHFYVLCLGGQSHHELLF